MTFDESQASPAYTRSGLKPSATLLRERKNLNDFIKEFYSTTITYYLFYISSNFHLFSPKNLAGEFTTDRGVEEFLAVPPKIYPHFSDIVRWFKLFLWHSYLTDD